MKRLREFLQLYHAYRQCDGLCAAACYAWIVSGG